MLSPIDRLLHDTTHVIAWILLNPASWHGPGLGGIPCNRVIREILLQVVKLLGFRYGIARGVENGGIGVLEVCGRHLSFDLKLTFLFGLRQVKFYMPHG